MCGIAGIVGVALPSSGRLIRAFCDAFVRRGPDGEGYFINETVALGMRRLSVIDLVHGWQPLFSRGQRVVAFQNGEIYNFADLRRELIVKGYVFVSCSDTEVLAHGYDAWGMQGLLEKVDGMYAMAILDLDSRRLYLARDRFGEKPLFFNQQNGVFAFGSDLQALVALPWIEAGFDPSALEYYLALHFVPGSMTIFKSVSKLLPGHFITIDIDKPASFQVQRYFRQTLGSPKTISTDRLAGVLENAVISRMVSDVSLGVFLSGGLDSSVVAAIAAKESTGISTFSMGFDSAEHDESPYARRVAQHIGSDHHHFNFDSGQFLDLLPKVAGALDEPIGDQACLPLYWLCGEARKYVTVALAGEGADEIFAGYGYYRDFSPEPGLKAYFRALLRGHTKPLLDQRIIHNNPPVTPSGFPLLTDIAGRIALNQSNSVRGPDPWESDILEWLATSNDRLQSATAADLATWLPDDLLVKFDRMAMAHSLEGRAPFLAPTLVDAALHLPGTQRMAKGSSKIALRRIAERWLPDDIVHRKKQGFVLPMKSWLKDWFYTHGGVDTYFASREVSGLDMNAATAMVQDDIASGLNRERFIFALVMLAEWCKQSEARVESLRRSYSKI
jgi:asparagine synthase (glutamine-hydrolysing)